MVLDSDHLTVYLSGCRLMNFKWERALEMQYNPEIVRMVSDSMVVCIERIGFPGEEEPDSSFVRLLYMEVIKRITESTDTISKGELFDCVLEILEEHLQYFISIGKMETKDVEKYKAPFYAYQKKLNKHDPIVHYQGQTMRYSKFVVMDRKPAFVVPIRDGMKLAVDAAELQAKLDAFKINIKVQDLEVQNDRPTKEVDPVTDENISIIMGLMEAMSKIELNEKKKKKAQTGGTDGASADSHGEGPSTSADA